jgi:hypothetical protein
MTRTEILDPSVCSLGGGLQRILEKEVVMKLKRLAALTVVCFMLNPITEGLELLVDALPRGGISPADLAGDSVVGTLKNGTGLVSHESRTVDDWSIFATYVYAATGAVVDY